MSPVASEADIVIKDPDPIFNCFSRTTFSAPTPSPIKILCVLASPKSYPAWYPMIRLRPVVFPT